VNADEDTREQQELAEQMAFEARLGFDSQPLIDSPYFDDEGQPQLVEAAVLFLDLLGTRGTRTAAEARTHLRDTHRAVAQARRWSLAGGDKRQEGAIYSFSDNVGLGYPVDGGWTRERALAFLCFEVSYLQLAFRLHGLFSRGAIALDLFFADPSLEFIYGPALERAVYLEHGHAVYPRVILDEAALAIASTARAAAEEGASGISAWRDQLLVDEHGVVFVNYLHTLFDEAADDVPSAHRFLQKHRNYIAENLRRHEGKPRVEDKYRWAAAYHNHFVETYGPDKLEGEIAPLLVRCVRPLGQFTSFGL
jgi:hypothetical protein